MHIEPVVLEGQVVRLEPLRLEVVPALFSVSRSPDIWRFLPYGPMPTLRHLERHVRDLLDRQARGTDLCFVVRHLATARIIGMTRYLNIDRVHRALEIGGTWYGGPQRGPLVNLEAKRLLLRHAFEALGCIRVQLKTDVRNLRSQRAIERLGAVREGLLRSHMILPDGRRRDSVYYSILDTEWPRVRAMLDEELAQGALGRAA